MTAFDDALALLTVQVQASVYPTMSQTELTTILNANRRFTVWAPNTAYAYGALVEPTVPNGHLYRCICAGTSDATEPYWAGVAYTTPDERDGLTRPYWHGNLNTMPGSQMSDGPTLMWQEGGYDAQAQWNVRKATYQAWLQKAAKASADYDTTVGLRNQFLRSQVGQNCLKMAQLYKPNGIY